MRHCKINKRMKIRNRNKTSSKEENEYVIESEEIECNAESSKED